MFYSHEILTNKQHGVATIWLLATVGPRGGERKVTRKAIQEVDVKRACETIIEPGAPLALRLQGNLLFGVSRVYAQQCKYVLTDATKVQQDMLLFFHLHGQNATDPHAGKATREQNMLSDDPNFIPDANIPHFDFGTYGSARVMPSQSSSRNGYSQLSPIDSIISSGGRAGSMMSFNLSHSDLASLHLPTPLAPKSSKRTTLEEVRIDQAQELNDLDAVGDIELEIDANGNILGFLDPFDDPGLPPLPFQEPHEDGMNIGSLSNAGETLSEHARQGREHQPLFDGDGDILMIDDATAQVGVADNAQREDQEQQEQQVQQVQQEQEEQPEQVSIVKSRSVRKRKDHGINADDITNYSVPTLRAWQNEYVQRNAEEIDRNFPPKISIADARLNAHQVVFGQGLAGVGLPNGIPGFEHPLSKLFAGDALKNMVFGVVVEDASGSENGSRRRRSASEAFSEDQHMENARRVRPRVDETPLLNEVQEQDAQQGFDNMGFDFGDEPAPEEARRGVEGLDERMSSSLMPWNRTPSVHQPSSVIGSKQRPEIYPVDGSPKEHIAAPIERYSDIPGVPSSELGFGPAPSVHSDFEAFGPAAFVTTQEAQESQWMNTALDKASDEFLGYVNERAKENGGLLEGDNDGRLWVEFEELATPGKHTKIVAAQAFLHVLTLATKNVIKVDQDAIDNQPFETIHIGALIDLDTEESETMSQ